MEAASQPSTDLLARARAGERGAVESLLASERGRIQRMIALRMDARLRGRVDVSDVVQESLLEATQRIDDWRAQPDMPFVTWLRFLAGQRLVTLARHHLGVQARDARREVGLGFVMPDADMDSVAREFAVSQTSASLAAQREEVRARVAGALTALEPIDREILVLRHFEELSNEEAARELGIDTSAASKRFLRALQRLRAALHELERDVESC